MYKVVIADDEKVIQEGLLNLVDWKSLGFEIVSVFSDGADVIEYLNSMPVDVVLTDVKMKHINGIVTAKYIYENEIPCKVVFISGYKEFELVVQALRFGVEDYILKPSKVEEVRAVFQKIKKELDEREKDLEFRRKTEKHWEEVYPILEEKFLSEMAVGALRDKNDIKQRMQILYPDIDAEHCPCMLAEILIEDYDAYMSKKWEYSTEQFDETIYNFIKIFNKNSSCHVIFKNKDRIRLFIMLKSYKMTYEENYALCDEVCEDFSRQFKDIFNLNARLVPEQYFPSVLHMADSKLAVIESADKKDTEMQLRSQKKLIVTNIMLGNISTAQKMMRSILLSLADSDSREGQNFALDVFSNIRDFLQDNNQGLFALVKPYMDYHTMMNMEINQLAGYCDYIFDVMKSQEGLSNQFDKGSLVNQIKEYVNKHIYEDISLENVADELFISVSQLNRILKKQTGETFLQYVNRKKMDKAVELLHNPQYKVYQVGECLGFKTTRYFSKMFYNYWGYYPSQYRKDILKIGDGSNEED